MAEKVGQVNFREIAVEDDVVFVRTELQENSSHFENSSLDVWVTDGSEAWHNSGTRRKVVNLGGATST
jgi:hypothetical protein